MALPEPQWACAKDYGTLSHKSRKYPSPSQKKGDKSLLFHSWAWKHITVYMIYVYYISCINLPSLHYHELVFPSNSKSWRSGFSENSTSRAVLWALLSVPECSLHRRSVCSVQFHQLNHHLGSALQCGIPGWLSALCQARRVDCSLPKWWIPAYIWFWKMI